MKISNSIKIAIIIFVSSIVTGCAIGESESECPGKPDGVLCMGPREVMEETNNKDDLSYLMEGKKKAKEQGSASDNLYPSQVTPPPVVSQKIYNVSSTSGTAKSNNALAVSNGPAGTVNPFNSRTYDRNADIPRSKDLYSVNNGQSVNPNLNQAQIQQYRQQGLKQAVVAPEPLAVLQQGKVMRVTFAPYTDDNNALNLPGYVYVSVKQQTWIAGKSATDNPARIIPLEVQDDARVNMQEQQKATQAINANGVRREL